MYEILHRNMLLHVIRHTFTSLLDFLLGEDEGVTEREHRVQVQRFFREISSQTEKQEFQELQ